MSPEISNAPPLIPLDGIPDEGQFNAIWKYRGEPWSWTFKVVDGMLYAYDSSLAAWAEAEHMREFFKKHPTRFIGGLYTLGEDKHVH